MEQPEKRIGRAAALIAGVLSYKLRSSEVEMQAGDELLPALPKLGPTSRRHVYILGWIAAIAIDLLPLGPPHATMNGGILNGLPRNSNATPDMSCLPPRSDVRRRCTNLNVLSEDRVIGISGTPMLAREGGCYSDSISDLGCKVRVGW